jgi:hypothetical protein
MMGSQGDRDETIKRPLLKDGKSFFLYINI